MTMRNKPNGNLLNHFTEKVLVLGFGMCYKEEEKEMRIQYKLPEMYENSQYRTTGRFLWRPLLIGNEMRWLEFAFILQEDMAAPNWARGTKWRIEDWENIAWLDKKERQ